MTEIPFIRGRVDAYAQVIRIDPKTPLAYLRKLDARPESPSRIFVDLETLADALQVQHPELAGNLRFAIANSTTSGTGSIYLEERVRTTTY